MQILVFYGCLINVITNILPPALSYNIYFNEPFILFAHICSEKAEGANKLGFLNLWAGDVRHLLPKAISGHSYHTQCDWLLSLSVVPAHSWTLLIPPTHRSQHPITKRTPNVHLISERAQTHRVEYNTKHMCPLPMASACSPSFIFNSSILFMHLFHSFARVKNRKVKIALTVITASYLWEMKQGLIAEWHLKFKITTLSLRTWWIVGKGHKAIWAGKPL